MSYLKSITLNLLLLFFHTSYASEAKDPLLENPAEIIKAMASEVRNIAESLSSTINSRIAEIESIIEKVQSLSISQPALFSMHQRRCLFFVECLAWDVHRRLNEHVYQFYLEPSLKRDPPSSEIRSKCFAELLRHDIKNKDLRAILIEAAKIPTKIEVAKTPTKKDRDDYEALKLQFESFGQSLAGVEKEEFDLYRMILLPQLIRVPR